jgi:hypothetical protein
MNKLVIFILCCFLSGFSISQILDSIKQRQELQTVNVSASIIKRESKPNLHIIDFHIIDGDMYTLQNDIHQPNVKYLCKNDSCFLIDKKAKIFHKDFRNQLIVAVKDSVYLLANTGLEPFESLLNYERFLADVIGNNEDYLYYKNTFFYNLIDEYLAYTIKSNELKTIHLTHDSASFFFIAQHYKDITNKIFLTYKYPHPRAHKYFLNTEKIKISKLTNETGQLFKQLSASAGFVGMTSILERSRSEAVLFDSLLYICDFNNYEFYTLKENKLLDKQQLKLSNFQYKNKFAADYVDHKAYYYVKTNYKHKLLEVDLEDNLSRYLNFLENFKLVYHWEVDNGRLYFLINNGNLEWQRILYSYDVDDVRLTIKN